MIISGWSKSIYYILFMVILTTTYGPNRSPRQQIQLEKSSKEATSGVGVLYWSAQRSRAWDLWRVFLLSHQSHLIDLLIFSSGKGGVHSYGVSKVLVSPPNFQKKNGWSSRLILHSCRGRRNESHLGLTNPQSLFVPLYPLFLTAYTNLVWVFVSYCLFWRTCSHFNFAHPQIQLCQWPPVDNSSIIAPWRLFARFLPSGTPLVPLLPRSTVTTPLYGGFQK